jgi:para-aminobenzoate synthetase component 1
LSRTATTPPPTFPVSAGGIRSTFSGDAYATAVRRAIELILAGDIFQVNLSQRFEAPAPDEPARVYLRLREASPAPFGAFFRSGDAAVLSNSPERFLRVDTDGLVQTRPIKGTRPRDADPGRDRGLEAELAASAKDRAENLMIVDLLRNDLSRVCGPGHVLAVDLFRVESFATVHHLVSTVEGRLRPDRGRVDLLRAAFPSGSVTGAPKLRAMEIIAELEPVARGPYCGAIGYLGCAGDMDTSVSIRIAVSLEDRILFHAGGAVVADSDPVAEYEETLHKARALLDVAEGGSP